MKQATWHITDTLTRRVAVLSDENADKVQIRASSANIWVPRSELSDIGYVQ